MVGTLQGALVAGLIAIGCFFLTVGTIGLLRFPNVYNRMHATSKPTTLGTAAIFLAGFVRFWPDGAAVTSLVGIVFLMLTVPTGAHMIARSAQRIGIPFEDSVTWPEPASESRRDEFRRDGAETGESSAERDRRDEGDRGRRDESDRGRR